MTDIDIEAIKTAALAATPGEWHVPGLAELHDASHRVIASFSDVEPVDEEERPEPDLDEGDRNARFVAAAQPVHVLALIERLERAERDLAIRKDTNGVPSSGANNSTLENMIALGYDFYIVRTQAGFRKSLKSYRSDLEWDDLNISDVVGYPREYPALVSLSVGYRGYHYMDANCIPLRLLYAWPSRIPQTPDATS